MGGVAFLPQELARTQEGPGSFFPTHHVGPLVDQQRQIPVRLNPALVHAPDDRLGGRAHHQGFLQLLATAVGHHRHLRGESFDVLRLFLYEALRYQQREVRVHVPARFEHGVYRGLHPLPQRVTGRADDHAAPNRAVVRQLRLNDDVGVPIGIARTARCDSFCHATSLAVGRRRVNRTAPRRFR